MYYFRDITWYLTESIQNKVIELYERGMPIQSIAFQIRKMSWNPHVPSDRAAELCAHIIVKYLKEKKDGEVKP